MRSRKKPEMDMLTRRAKLFFMLYCPLPLLVPSSEISVAVFLACCIQHRYDNVILSLHL